MASKTRSSVSLLMVLQQYVISSPSLTRVSSCPNTSRRNSVKTRHLDFRLLQWISLIVVNNHDPGYTDSQEGAPSLGNPSYMSKPQALHWLYRYPLNLEAPGPQTGLLLISLK